MCVGQFSRVLPPPVCSCYSFIEPLRNCFSCNLLLPVDHCKNPEKRSLRFRTLEGPERYNWACSVVWPDLEHTYGLDGGIYCCLFQDWLHIRPSIILRDSSLSHPLGTPTFPFCTCAQFWSQPSRISRPIKRPHIVA